MTDTPKTDSQRFWSMVEQNDEDDERRRNLCMWCCRDSRIGRHAVEIQPGIVACLDDEGRSMGKAWE